MTNSMVDFIPDINNFIQDRSDKPYTVVCGANNSGKSLVLKHMRLHLPKTAYMMGPQRFYHVHEIPTEKTNQSDYDNADGSFRNEFGNIQFNHENNRIELRKIIVNLNDKKRKKLFDLCESFLGNTFSLKRTVEDNDLSPRYIAMDDQNVAVGSTGTRLLMTLLGLCMDENFSVILIDEPELGLSPRIQSALAEFFRNLSQRKKVFPHLDRIIVATHSHLFLDRVDLSNNFTTSKKEATIYINQINDIMSFHNLQFNLLGNSLESLFLPSAIIVVEGKTDKPYLDRVIQTRFPNRKILVIESQGDVKRVFKSISDTLGDIQKSPLRSRTFVVLDSIHSRGTKENLVKMGARAENIVIWEHNGIEYMYPSSIVSSIFACGEANINDIIKISSDEVSANGIVKRKAELVAEVVDSITDETSYPEELESKLLKPLADSIEHP